MVLPKPELSRAVRHIELPLESYAKPLYLYALTAVLSIARGAWHKSSTTVMRHIDSGICLFSKFTKGNRINNQQSPHSSKANTIQNGDKDVKDQTLPLEKITDKATNMKRAWKGVRAEQCAREKMCILLAVGPLQKLHKRLHSHKYNMGAALQENLGRRRA